MIDFDLNKLFSQVFGYDARESGHRFGFLTDVPNTSEQDTPDWRARRELVAECAQKLSEQGRHACIVYAYASVGRSNADLIRPVSPIALGDAIPATAADLEAYPSQGSPVAEVYARAEFWIALTQHSATAPLKLAAARYGFRAATMPGFTLSMLPALSVDLEAVDARVSKLARLLTASHAATLTFDAFGAAYTLRLDLRHRMGFASSGRFLTNGQAGNLPSGEAYIVPYEGECAGVLSRTSGIMPIECGGELALCEVAENRIVCVEGSGTWVDGLRASIAGDPARANIAELGLGVLGEFGIEAVGHVLLDEKLAVHIALGRSEHLGGVTSPADFLSPSNVCHIDYVYHHKLMPHVRIARGVLETDDNAFVFVENDKYRFDAI